MIFDLTTLMRAARVLAPVVDRLEAAGPQAGALRLPVTPSDLPR